MLIEKVCGFCIWHGDGEGLELDMAFAGEVQDGIICIN